jgi:transposase
MPRKRQRLCAREFSSQFTKIVSRHLSTLPVEEQDQRIKKAERTAVSATGAERPTVRRVAETRTTPLRYRTHE